MTIGPTMRVTIEEDVIRALERHARSARERAGGLLLGSLQPDSVAISRSVPTPNVAPAELRERGYRLDPGALRNVARTATGLGLEVVGVYTIGGGPDERSCAEDEKLNDSPPLLVAATGDGAGHRVWWREARSVYRELPFHVVPPSRRSLLQCAD